MSTLTLPGGTLLDYRDEGTGRPVVLVHGVNVDASIWDDLVPLLPAGLRIVAPTLPLGAHRHPVPAGTPLTLPALAGMVAALLDALGLEDVVLVGNDTGGAIAQLVAARHPERLGALVLVACDTAGNLPPLPLRPLAAAARLPHGLAPVHALLRLRAVRRLFVACVARTRLPDSRVDAAFAPLLEDPGVRRDHQAVLAGLRRRELEGARPARPLPATVVWAQRDPLFPAREGERLAAALGAPLHRVDRSRAFVQVDRPDALAAILAGAAQAPQVGQGEVPARR